MTELLEILGPCETCKSENVARITAKYPDGSPDKVFKYCWKCKISIQLKESVTEKNKKVLKKVGEMPLSRAQRRARAGSSKKGVGNANKSRK